MKRSHRLLARVALAVLGSIPAAAILTLATTGLWRWVEATTGIESIGHSGPSTWCYDIT